MIIQNYNFVCYGKANLQLHATDPADSTGSISFLLPDHYPIFNTSSIIGTSSILYHLG